MRDDRTPCLVNDIGIGGRRRRRRDSDVDGDGEGGRSEDKAVARPPERAAESNQPWGIVSRAKYCTSCSGSKVPAAAPGQKSRYMARPPSNDVVRALCFAMRLYHYLSTSTAEASSGVRSTFHPPLGGLRRGVLSSAGHCRRRCKHGARCGLVRPLPPAMLDCRCRWEACLFSLGVQMAGPR